MRWAEPRIDALRDAAVRVPQVLSDLGHRYARFGHPDGAKLESGEGNLTAEKMRQFADAYGCEPWELLEEAPLLSPEAKRLVAILAECSPEGVRAIADLAKMLFEKENPPSK